MSRVKLIGIGVVAVALLFAGMAAVFAVGYKSGQAGDDARTFVRRVISKVGLPVPEAFQPESSWTESYETILLTLEAKGIAVPVERGGRGGGMTSFGSDVLLLTYEGRLFAVAGPDSVIELDVGIPDNGFEAYRRASESEKFASMNFDLTTHRYNDVLYYDSAQARGLAISYTEYFEEAACYTTTVATLDLPPEVRSAAEIKARAEDWRILFRTEPCMPLKTQMRAMEGHMAGGRMAFKAPSTIYLASGDYHWDGMYAPDIVAQRPDWDYGKVMELDIASGESRMYSMGHRNPQGITFDAAGQLWVVEHGPRGGDELNRVEQGANYGWPRETLGTMYSGLPVPNTMSYGRHDSFAAPTFAWLPSVGVSSLKLIDGFHSSWDGDLIMTSLAGHSVYRLRITDASLQFAEEIDVGRRVRYVLQHTDGRLVLWTDDSHELIFLTPAKRGAALEFLETKISGKQPELAATLRQALDGCMECHSLNPGTNTNAPSLAAVYDNDIASTEFPRYSNALRSLEGRWTRDNLISFLSAPQTFAPGTTMPPSGYDDPTVLEGLVDLLAAIKDAPLE